MSKLQTLLRSPARLAAFGALAGAMVLAGWVLAAGATYVVNTTTDTAGSTCSGSCSLRQAVGASNASGSTNSITLPAGTYALSGGELAITASVVVNGAGAGSTIINCQGGSRAFNVSGNANLTLNNLTITNCRTGNAPVGGGAVLNGSSGNLSLSSVTISSSQALNGYGGAVYSAGGTTTLTSTTLSGNTAQNGGGLYQAAGALVITGSSLSSNTAQNGGGGAVYLNGTSAALSGSTVSSNTATSLQGGGLYLTVSAASSLSTSTLSGNNSNNSGGGAAYLAGSGAWTLSSNSFEGNSAGNGGGGLYVASTGGVSISASTFYGNIAMNSEGAGLRLAASGGSASVANSTFYQNSSNLSGGGAAVTAGTLSILASTFTANIGDNGAGALLNNGGTLSIGNTLLTGNAGLAGNCSGTISTTGYNLDSGSSCLPSPGTGDLRNNSSAGVGSFGENGGPTRTVALQTGSAAIGAGNPALSTLGITSDQRGVSRVSPPSIGAYEGGVTTYGLSGTVFEDLNYGGGAGRSLAASGGIAISGARVELFNSSGSYVSATTSAANGSYSFNGLSAGTTYHVRVVSSSVLSTRTGSSASLLGVMTYRTNTSSGTVSGVTDHVGGFNPTMADAGNASAGSSFSTSTYVFNVGPSGTAHAVAPVGLASASVSGVDFGFNFSTVVNTNDSGQGSLRQAITNANALGGDSSLAQSGRTAGIENLIFMLPNGTSGSGGSLALSGGLRSTYNVFTTDGGDAMAATITLSSDLPYVTSPLIMDAQTQPGWSSGNPRPIVEINGANSGGSAIINGLTLSSGNSTVRGFVVNGFAGRQIVAASNGNVIQGNWLGVAATGRAASRRGGYGVTISGANNLVGGSTAAQRNVASGLIQAGVYIETTSATGNTVTGNYLGTNSTGTSAVASNSNYGVWIDSGASGNTVGGSGSGLGNLIAGNSLYGVWINAANNSVIGNLVGVTDSGAAVGNTFDGIFVSGASTVITGNVVGSNGRHGILLMESSTSTVVTGNTIGLAPDGSTLRANGHLAVRIRSSNNTIGGTSSGAGNIIYSTSFAAVAINSGAKTGNAILGNSIRMGSSIPGIDLVINGFSANDGAKTANQSNLMMDAPVFTGASLAGTTLTVSGYVGSAASQSTFGGSRVEVFIADASSAFGSGQTYLGYLTADASGNFSGSIEGVSGVTPGTTAITGTATDTSNNTSEFGANFTVLPGIAGTVFEDARYGGGAGRNLATSTGTGLSGARVELYNSSGAYVTFTTTGAGGSYAFTGLAAGNYYVRVVSSTVLSARTGSSASLLPVLTYRTQATTGTAVDVADHVGGTNPAVADPGAASSGATFSTSSFVYSAGLSGTAQAVAPVTLGSADITGVDFGFNFSTVVNTNDSGQGSLRQAITNANALGGDSSLAQSGRTAGIENLIFMISNGTTGSGGSLNLAAGGLRSNNNYFSGGVATINPASELPNVSTPMVINAQAQPGWSSSANAPVVALDANNAVTGNGIRLASGSGGSTLQGLAIGGFGTSGIRVDVDGAVIRGNFIGVAADGVTARPNGAPASVTAGVFVTNGNGVVIGGASAGQRNVLSGNGGSGVWVSNGSVTIIGNYIGTDASGMAALANYRWGVHVQGGTGTRIGGAAAGEGNVIAGHAASATGGIYLFGNAAIVQGNIIGMNATATAALPNGNGVNQFAGGIDVRGGSGHLIGGTGAGEGNLIAGNQGHGIRVTSTATRIMGNAIYNNLWLGIDLAANGVTANDTGDADAGDNNLQNYPVLASALTNGSTQTIVTGTLNSEASSYYRIEFFASTSADTTGYGEGQRYLGFANVATDASGNATINTTLATSVAAGEFISATATKSDSAFTSFTDTSEFSLNVTAAFPRTIGGTVFEDVNYGGGAGRSLAASGGAGVAGATVELYNSSGAYVSSTTSASDGSYSFSNLAAGTYYVRVASSTVLSQRSGSTSSLLGVLTYRTTATTGTAVAVADHVGGTNPAVADPGAASSGATFSTSSFVYSAGLSGTAQAVAPVTLGSADITGVDFGFNFSTVVNTNDSGQGSLRQAITNANALGGDSSLAQSGRTAGIENLIFMISNGTTGSGGSLNLAAGGLRSSNNYFSGGVATISPTSELPAASTPMVINAQAQPGWATTPVLRLDGASAPASANGLTLNASDSGVRGLSITNFYVGVAVAGSGHWVAGNHIGIDAAGTTAAANRDSGVYAFGASGLVVGGSAAADRNVISGNVKSGVFLHTGTTGASVQGNYIGLNAAGTAAIPNNTVNQTAYAGVTLNGATSSLIGGAGTAQRNIISGNNQSGVHVQSGSTGNTVAGNYIGTDAGGTAALPNGANGVLVEAHNTTVGGSSAAAGNVITGKGSASAFGVRVDTVSGVTVQYNKIGTNAAGSAALSAPAYGLALLTASNGIVRDNQVSGNGIGIWLAHGSGHTLYGNLVGTNATASGTIANTGYGLWISGAANNNTIGGTNAGEANTFAYNRVGVRLSASGAGAPQRQRISGNRIHGNTALGIDLTTGLYPSNVEGVNANDGATSSGQPNLFMDHPVFTSAILNGTTLSVTGYVGGAANQTAFAGARVEIFISDNDSSGYGEGQTYLGYLNADANGNFSGTLTGVSGVTANSSKLTGTATDSLGNTSEFGPNLTVTLPGIGGKVFEDPNYGGGAGRSLAASGGVGVAGATLELYNSSGAYVSSTTSASDGSYSFSNLAAGTYYVRVASSTVLSQRSGSTSSLLGVLTYRTTATTGTAVAVADHVGGTNPAVADPGAASSGATFSTSSFVYSAGLSGTAHAVAPVTLGSADITGVDFGFNFSTVVNTNDSGQGSLRQAITNANTLGGDSSLAQSGRTAGIEHVLFMLSNGTTGSGGSLNLAAGGLRSSNNYFSGGVATIAPTSTLPALTTPMVLDAQAQPGWTLNPLIELNGAAVTATPYGLQLRGGSTVRGFIINRFSQRGINTSVAGGNTISGNWLGLSSTGGAASSAMLFGLFIDTAGDVVGGSTAAARNVVSGCSTGGILVNTNASATRITGNYIGTNAAGSAAVAVAGSKNYGVRVLNATGVQIGGTAAGEGNLISGNDGAGVRLEGNGNVVEGNHIGTNLDGTAALANLLSGVQLAISGASTAQGNRIGGTSSAARNVISGNGLDGLHVIGASIANNDIQGNYIGTNAAGTAAVPNQRFGVYIANDASGNRVGGSASGAGNLISGNVLSGVRMAMAGAANAVRGNAIGVNAVGTAALPNGDMGIYLVQSNGQIIGGAEPGAGNVASGNALDGISINDSSSNTVQGNRIGTNAAGTLALPNQRYGVWLTNTSQNNAIGGINAGEGNTIANSGSDGVNISLGDNSGNTIRGNSIFSNAGLGIDLLGAVGVDANDGVKTALQANLLMDSPVLTSARARGNQLTVAGYVGSAANQSTFASAMVEIFVSDQTSSHGSGKTLLGSLTADASGNFSGTLSMPVSALARGVQLTATATDTSGNTSEFGANFTGLLVDFVVNHNGDAADASPGDGLCQTSTTDQCTLRAAIEELNALGTQAAGTPTLAFALPGCAVGGEAACQIAPSSALSAITAPVDINGQTQPGWSTRPLIELNGSGAGASVNGLWLTGGSSSVRGLVINNFSARGLRFSSGSSYTVAGNWIGIRADGLAAAGNGTFGIQSDRPSVTIGGVTDADRNVIAGNGGTGIFSQGETATIYGNWIGLLPDGLSAAPNQRGIQLSGSGITNTTIGGPLAGQGNVISGNQRPAIRIYDAGANSGIRIQGNRIGLAANQDTPVPNATDPVAEGSVLVDGDTQGVLIGGSGAGEGNIIAATSNASAVVLESSAGTPQAIRILGNSMYGSSELGIDLGKDGVSANDGLTSAAQANNGMDYPVFTGAGVADAGTSITVSGYIGTGTGQAVFAGARVEIFVSDANPTGYGEGKTYLGFLTSDANGRFAGTVSVSAGSINVGDPITATATDAAGHTSEFGPNFSSTTMAALSPGSFNAFDTDTAANALTGVLRSRVAGASTSVDVIALDQSSSGLHVGFTGDVSLRWLDARDDSGAVTGSCRSSWVDLGSAGMASFSSNSRLTVNLTPPASATRSMRLQMSYAGTAGTITSCSTDAFAALPASLAWLGASDGDAATAGTTRTLDNTSASGGVVHRAGRPFTVRAEARTATGAVMTGYDGAPTLAISSCVLPSGCTAGALGGGQVAAAAGVYTHSSVTYSEVGAINLSLTDDSFGAVDTADTPAAARTVSASALAVGRFVPDGYVLSVSRQGQFATANAACMASGSAATFFGQGFGWALTPRVTVTAVNAAGATTLLWADALMTLTGAHATPSLAVAGAGAASLSSSFGTMSISALGSGQALIEPNITDRFLLELASGTLQPTQTPTWTWALAVNDSSQAGVSGNPSITANISSSGPTFDQGGSFHAGRLTLAAAYGDARSGVRALVQLQRWTSAGWVTVTEDRGCATVQPQNLGVDQASGVFSTAGVCASPMAGAVTTRGGRAWISLPASPGGATGRLRLTLAGDAASGTACSGGGTVSLQTLALPWLLSGTAGTGPQAMATWGSPRRDLVLRREIW